MSTNKNINIIEQTIASREIILEMLHYRGYDISKYQNHTPEELKLLLSNGLMDMELTHTTNNKELYVKYLILNKIKNITLTKEINELILNHFKDKNNNNYEIIIIIKDRKTDSLQAVIDSYLANKYNIQVFWIKNLLYNVLNHEFQPQFRVLNSTEIIELRKKFNIQKNGLPIISKNDPVAQYIGMVPGNICEIIRNSETSGKYLTYRICV